MKISKIIFTVVSIIALSGCLSICRVPFPEHEDFSDDGVCTNRTWHVLFDDQVFRNESWTVYPTIYMRCVATGVVFSPIDYTKKGEELYREKNKYWASIPLTILWFTSPIDAIIDTIYLPWDFYTD